MTDENKTYQETFKRAVKQSFPTNYEGLSRSEVIKKIFCGPRNDEESLRVKDICERLSDFSKYDLGEGNKYGVLEGLIAAIRSDVANRLDELSGVTTCSEITEKDLEWLELEVHSTLELLLALEKTLGRLIDMRQVSAVLR